MRSKTEHFGTVVIGGGQAGLSAGYHLARRGIRVVILDAQERIGGAWRNRWDSLRLFSPARFDGLDGMPFPAPSHHFPTKNEMADYLESYANHFKLPVQSGITVDRLSKRGSRYLIQAGAREYEADNVIVAMSNYQKPVIPAFAAELDPGIVQVHSLDYRNPSQLRDGDVLLVGAGNSGADIAMELAASHRVLLSGRDTGHVPFRIASPAARFVFIPLLFRLIFHRVLTLDTPLGRKARPKLLSHGGTLIRIKPKDLAAAGVTRIPRIAGVRNGMPALDDGSVLQVANVVWCTGFEPGFSWIDLPVIEDGHPVQERGFVKQEPGLYFVGLAFLYSFSSSMIHGVGRDADRIAQHIANHRHTRSADRAGVGAPAHEVAQVG